jgi:hypothetical protein
MVSGARNKGRVFCREMNAGAYVYYQQDTEEVS